MSTDRDQKPEFEEKDQVYREIFEAAGDGLIVQDLETQRIVEANSAAAAMHGYSREEFIGLHLTEYIHPDSQPLFTESAQAVQSGGMFESPAIHLHRDGSSFHVEVRRTAFIYQGRPCLLSVVRDVSRRTPDRTASSPAGGSPPARTVHLAGYLPHVSFHTGTQTGFDP